jgi:hypothetical protein
MVAVAHGCACERLADESCSDHPDLPFGAGLSYIMHDA